MIGTQRSTRRNKYWYRALPLRLEILERRDTPSAGFKFDHGFSNLHHQTIVQPAAVVQSYYGLTPSMVRNAYGFDQISLNGAGQTIAIITAYDHPTIEDDLATFNKMFGLPNAPTFTRVSDIGTPRTNSGWSIETAMDVQWAHAIAPGASLMLVQAKSDRLGDMLDAVNYARYQPGVTAISMSWGLTEFDELSRFDRLFTTPNGHDGISFVAASGDFGGSGGTMWPASSPNVVAVGGTQLTTDASGNYQSEAAWSASTGGISRTGRQVPDVSYAADPKNGFFVYTSGAKQKGWYTVGGTSAGAPQWAGLFAVANQGRAEVGMEPISNARSAVSMLSDAAFHDVVSGSNGFTATKGFDLATGRGSPNATITVAQLMSEKMPTQAQFVGPLPDSSKLPKQTAQVPSRRDGALAQVAAAVNNRLSTNFSIDSLSLRDSQTAQFGRTAQTGLPSVAPILVTPTTPVSAVDLSSWGAGDSWEDEQLIQPAAPVPGGGDAAATPAEAAAKDNSTIFRTIFNDGRNRVMNVGYNVALNGQSTLIPEDADAAVFHDRASASPLLLAFLAGGFVLTAERKERQRARRMHS